MLVTLKGKEFGVENRQEFGLCQAGSKPITGLPDGTIYFKSAHKPKIVFEKLKEVTN